MLTLEQAIEHCHEKAKELRKQAAVGLDSMTDTIRVEECKECASDRNIGLKKVSTRNLISAMSEITEKYWDKGLRVVFKYYCGNGDEWKKCYESEATNEC